MKQANADIRRLVEKNNFKYWEVALKVGVDPTTLSKWLRIPLNETRRERVLSAINDLCAAEQ